MEKSGIRELSEKDFEEKVLKKENASVLDFYAPWCITCQTMMPIIEKLAAKYDKLDFFKINIGKNPKIAAKFHVMTLPTLIIFLEGKPKEQISGSTSQTQLENKIKKYI